MAEFLSIKHMRDTMVESAVTTIADQVGAARHLIEALNLPAVGTLLYSTRTR